MSLIRSKLTVGGLLSRCLQLLYHEDLTPFDLAVNRRLKRIVCLTHGAVIPPAHVRQHLFKSHCAQRSRLRRKRKKDFVRMIDKIVAELGVIAKPAYPPLPLAVELEFEGLTTRTGISCAVCRKGFLIPDKAKKHVSERGPCKGAILRASSQQHFTNSAGKAKTWFAVSRNHAPIDPAMNRVLAEAVRGMEEDAVGRSRISGDLPRRSLTTWLHTTGWHRAFHAHDTLILSGLGALPSSSDTYAALRPIVQELFRRAYDLIDATPESARCQLATPEPDR